MTVPTVFNLTVCHASDTPANKGFVRDFCLGPQR